jgi:hypothetical protein
MLLVIDRQGNAHCLYTEALDLALLGALSIHRASHVEPDAQGQWWADLTPVGGPRLGPFRHRSEAVAAEQQWLETFWLLLSSEKG